MIRILQVLILLIISIALAPAQEKTEWTEDYKVAVEVARAQDKSILLLFTGDWIPLCQKFEESILKTETFTEEVSEHFVLVKLNYPEDNTLPAEIAAQNQLLKDAYRVRGFPAIVLTDDEGRPFGLNGFQPITPEAYVEQILSMNEQGKEKEVARAEAGNLEGIAKAEKLIEGIPDLPGSMAARYYENEMKEVVAADPEDSLGKTEFFQTLLNDASYSKSMHLLAKESKWDQMIELTDSYISEGSLSGGALQKALLNKSSVQERVGALRGRVESLLQVVDIDADSPHGQEAQRQLDELRAEKLREEAGEGSAKP